jgi:hypothetical protein
MEKLTRSRRKQVLHRYSGRALWWRTTTCITKTQSSLRCGSTNQQECRLCVERILLTPTSTDGNSMVLILQAPNTRTALATNFAPKPVHVSAPAQPAEHTATVRAKIAVRFKRSISTLFGYHRGVRIKPCFACFLDRRNAELVGHGSWVSIYQVKLKKRFINDVLLQGNSEQLFAYANHIVDFANNRVSIHPPVIRG